MQAGRLQVRVFGGASDHMGMRIPLHVKAEGTEQAHGKIKDDVSLMQVNERDGPNCTVQPLRANLRG